MATRHRAVGMAHPTVVPENFTADPSTESDETEAGADGESDDGFGEWPA